MFTLKHLFYMQQYFDYLHNLSYLTYLKKINPCIYDIYSYKFNNNNPYTSNIAPGAVFYIKLSML